jgi:hypothetical protein
VAQRKKQTAVLINPDFFIPVTIRMFFNGAKLWPKKHQEAFSPDRDGAEVISALRQNHALALGVTKWSEHHLGPVLEFQTPNQETVRVLVPWSHIVSIIEAPAENIPIGFDTMSSV